MIPALEAGALALMRAEIAAGRRIGVAVSGGGDSMALLELASDAVGPSALRVATVDHGLRPEARDEARAVAARCARLGADHDLLIWDGDGRGGNLMSRAREARYALLSRWASGRALGVVLLGHTRDDVAETLLLGLARSAGLDGLSGIRPRFHAGGVAFLRPLLDAARSELRDLLVARGLSWREDPSNEDDRFDRVRMRKALAVLADDCGVSAFRLAESAAHLSDDRAAIRAHLHDWARRHVGQELGDLVIDRAAFSALPRAFARRILGHGLRWVSGAAYPPRADAVERLLSAGSGTLSGCLVSGGATVSRIAREPAAAARAPAVPVNVIWDGRWRITGPEAPGAHVAALGWQGLERLPADLRGGPSRASLAAGPALWRDGVLLGAPLAGIGEHRAALVENRDDFAANLLSY